MLICALLIVLMSSAYARSTTSESPPAGRRVALVIGNSRYRNVATLLNPSNDARLVAKTLKNLGFNLVGGTEQNDLGKRAFDRLIESFGDQIRGADVALFYYAGHGVQVRGSNYLVPIDANPTRESDVDFQLVDSETVLHQMQDADTRLNIIVLDACRNNPFGRQGLRSLGGGLAQMQAPEGTLISYATQPGSVAADGAGADSPFTLALVHQIQQPGQDIFRVFNQVGLDVEHQTNKEQQPWVSNSPIDGDFYFAGTPAAPPAGPPDADVVYWQSIEGSRNAADYQGYLKEFPSGHFVMLARSRATMYQHPALAAVSMTPAPSSTSVVHQQAARLSAVSSPAAAATQLASAEIPHSENNLGAVFNGDFVVIGDPLEKADAELMMKRFERFGYHPGITPSSPDGKFYSLRFGPYSSAEAKSARDDLLRHWHDLTFHLLVNSKAGDVMDREAAESAAELVKRLGASPSVVENQANRQRRYQVEIGPFVTQKEAMREGEELAQRYSDSLKCAWGGCDWQYTWMGAPPRLLCQNVRGPCTPDQ